jgi:hypothetical protein
MSVANWGKYRDVQVTLNEQLAKFGEDANFADIRLMAARGDEYTAGRA